MHNGTSQIWNLKTVSLRIRLDKHATDRFNLHYKIRIFFKFEFVKVN